MNWTLEVVMVPVSDIDRAKSFYVEQLGFNVDHDTTDHRRPARRSAHAARVGLLGGDW